MSKGIVSQNPNRVKCLGNSIVVWVGKTGEVENIAYIF